DAMGGLLRSEPALTAAGIALALSLAAVPGLGGFHYKEAVLAAAWDARAFGAVAVILAGDVLAALYMARFAHAIFLAPRPAPTRPVPASLKGPIHLLAAAAVVAGLWPGAVDRLVGPA